MKYIMKSLVRSFQFSQNRNEKTKCTSLNFPLLALAAGLVLAAGPAQAQNLLVNPGFETPPSGHALWGTTVATGWTYFSPPEPPGYFGDYWVQSGIAHGVAAYDGTCYWNEWGALYQTATNNVAGIYQTFSSSPGSIYQASGWMSSARPTLADWARIAIRGFKSSSSVRAVMFSPFTSQVISPPAWGSTLGFHIR